MQGHCLSAMLWKGPAHGHHAPAAAKPAPRPEAAPPAPPPPAAQPQPQPAPAPHGSHNGGEANGAGDMNGALAKLGRDTLVQAMEKTGWVQAKAARILGLTPRQIGYALKKHGIEMKRY